MRAGPSVVAFANPAFVDALAMSAATTLACVHAGTFDFHETGVTLTLVRCHAVAVIATLATRHASTCVSRSILRDGTRFPDSGSDLRVFEDESVVAFADFRCDARAIVAR